VSGRRQSRRWCSAPGTPPPGTAATALVNNGRTRRRTTLRACRGLSNQAASELLRQLRTVKAAHPEPHTPPGPAVPRQLVTSEQKLDGLAGTVPGRREIRLTSG
jgi:hypothetical protein